MLKPILFCLIPYPVRNGHYPSERLPKGDCLGGHLCGIKISFQYCGYVKIPF